MSQNDQQARRQLSFQQCIDELSQPRGSRPDGNSMVEAGNVNINIIISPQTLQRNADVTGNPLTNSLSTSHFSDVEGDNFQQQNVTTSNRGANTPRPRHPLYQAYENRLRSYSTWRQFQEFDIAALAEAGFYNLGVENGTTIRCFFCAVELVNPTYTDNPLIEHQNKSPNCGYLMQQLRTRDIIELQERIHIETQNSGQQDADAVETPSTSVRKPASCSTSGHSRNPQLEAYSARLASCARWPSGVRQRPEEQSAAGFFYTGFQDVVRCFACDGGLKNWDPVDDPWIEHARWFPPCPFVKRVKGQEFFDLVRRMTEDSDEDEDVIVYSTFQPSNPMADAPTLNNELNSQPGEGKLDYTEKDIMKIIMNKKDELSTEAHGHKKPLSPTPGIRTQENDPVRRLIQENERCRQSMKCVECGVAEIDILLLPCTHHCLCSNCSDKASICPLCHKKIREKIKTYVI